ncbi:MAG: hypothetical protein NVS9B4_28440 [Candidatus Acidiferrum sp.]
MVNELLVLMVTTLLAAVFAVGTVGPFLSLVFLLWRWRAKSQSAKQIYDPVDSELEPAAGAVA